VNIDEQPPTAQQLEDDHNDGYHDDDAHDGCWRCRPELGGLYGSP